MLRGLPPPLPACFPLPFLTIYHILVLSDQRVFGDRVLRDSFTLRIVVRQFCWDKLAHFASCLIYLPGLHPMGSRKRQVMSPTAHLPTVPTLLLILQWITAWYSDTAIVVYQLTGTPTCRHTSLSLPLAQFTAASLSLATYYRFNFAAASTNAAIMAIMTIVTTTLAQVPSRVLGGLRGDRVPRPRRCSSTGGWERRIPPDQQTNRDGAFTVFTPLTASSLHTHLHAPMSTPKTMDFRVDFTSLTSAGGIQKFTFTEVFRT